MLVAAKEFHMFEEGEIKNVTSQFDCWEFAFEVKAVARAGDRTGRTGERRNGAWGGAHRLWMTPAPGVSSGRMSGKTQ